MHRPAGAFADEASGQRAGRVEPGVARERARESSGAGGRSRAARRGTGRAAGSRQHPRAAARARGAAGTPACREASMAGNVPGSPVEGKGDSRGMTGGEFLYIPPLVSRSPDRSRRSRRGRAGAEGHLDHRRGAHRSLRGLLRRDAGRLGPHHRRAARARAASSWPCIRRSTSSTSPAFPRCWPRTWCATWRSRALQFGATTHLGEIVTGLRRVEDGERRALRAGDRRRRLSRPAPSSSRPASARSRPGGSASRARTRSRRRASTSRCSIRRSSRAGGCCWSAAAIRRSTGR